MVDWMGDDDGRHWYDQGIDVPRYKEMVRGPGRFEGEPPETAYYYEQAMNGDGEMFFPDLDDSDDDDRFFDGFEVNAEESEAFGLPIGSWYLIRTDSQGFIIWLNEPNRAAAEASVNKYFGV